MTTPPIPRKNDARPAAARGVSPNAESEDGFRTTTSGESVHDLFGGSECR